MMTNGLRASLQLTVFVLLTSVLVAGCGHEASIQEMCGQCGKDSTSIAACIKNNEQNKDVFGTIGCGSEFQSLLDCAFDNGTCTEQGTSGADGCEQKRVDILSCAGVL